MSRIGRCILPYGGSGGYVDLAVVCPAGGYIKEPGQPYVPPLDIGIPGDEEIYLLCENSGLGLVSITPQTNSVQWFFEVYDAGFNIVYTSGNYSSGNTATYNFTGSAGALYVVKIKLATAGHFTKFWVNQTTYGGDYPILQAKFNTPAMTDLSNAFKNTLALQDVQFISEMTALTTLYYAFNNCGLKYWKPGKTFTALTNISYLFYQSYIEKVDFSDSSFPAVTTAATMCRDASNLYEFIFPASMPLLANFSYAFYNSGIEKLTLFTSAPNVTNYSSPFYNCFYLGGTLEIPTAEGCTALTGFVQNCYLLQGLKFNGIMPLLTQFGTLISNCYKLKSLELPRQMGDSTHNASGSSVIINNYELETLILPDLIYSNNFGYTLQKKIKSITGDFENPTMEMYITVPFASNLETYNTPKAKMSYLWIGTSLGANKLTAIELDWTNSSFSGAYTPVVRLYAALDSTELNRIMTALPTVTGTKTFSISLNPGYAGCDTSIATAKGWMVS